MNTNIIRAGIGGFLAMAALAAAPASAQMKFGTVTGNAAAGAANFAPCKACHVTTKGVNRVGPSLHGIIGRKAGSVPGYKYSAANLKSGVVWTPAVMYKYLENPRGFMPGTKMTYAGLKDPQKRANVVAWLATQK